MRPGDTTKTNTDKAKHTTKQQKRQKAATNRQNQQNKARAIKKNKQQKKRQNHNKTKRPKHKHKKKRHTRHNSNKNHGTHEPTVPTTAGGLCNEYLSPSHIHWLHQTAWPGQGTPVGCTNGASCRFHHNMKGSRRNAKRIQKYRSQGATHRNTPSPPQAATPQAPNIHHITQTHHTTNNAIRQHNLDQYYEVMRKQDILGPLHTGPDHTTDTSQQLFHTQEPSGHRRHPTLPEISDRNRLRHHTTRTVTASTTKVRTETDTDKHNQSTEPSATPTPLREPTAQDPHTQHAPPQAHTKHTNNHNLHHSHTHNYATTWDYNRPTPYDHTQSTHPPLPPGWQAKTTQDGKTTIYVNTSTRSIQRENPTTATTQAHTTSRFAKQQNPWQHNQT